MRKLMIIATILLGMTGMAMAQNPNVTLPQKPNRAKYVDYQTKQTGFWAAAQLGGGFASTGDAFGQVDLIGGYRFSEFLKVGIGISPRFGGNAHGDMSIPVYAHIRGNFISQEDTMWAFYYSGDVGASINAGFYLSPSVGVRYGGIRHNALLSIFYALETQKQNVQADPTVPVDPVHPSHLVGLRIGYEF